MCIKIVRTKEEISYDMSQPLEEQIRGSKQIVINYQPEDVSVVKFLSEIERLCKTGVTAQLNIKVIHNNNLSGARVKKDSEKLLKDLKFNEVIKLMALTQSETDRKLQELANYCMDRNCNVKP